MPSDPRTPTERRLDAPGAIELRHPEPSPAPYAAFHAIHNQLYATECDADGCDVDGHVPARALRAFDREDVPRVTLCREHATERDRRLRAKRDHLEAEARDARHAAEGR
jgi:hypothetical protein